MIITGIGSRETPKEILEEMTKIGEYVLHHKFVIRSGHADGADWAFELGAQERCLVYLPWNGFNDKLISNAKSIVVPDDEKYKKITNQFHPNPNALSRGGRLLMNRNACQILGINLDKPSNYVVCWTKDGGSTGGTGQALRIAADHKIPILNMFFEEYNTADKIVSALAL